VSTFGCLRDGRTGLTAPRSSRREREQQCFVFDIEHNHYWHPLFGRRPDRLSDAVEVALRLVEAAPPLVPVYSHRFLTTHRTGRRPVLSVWQASDSIIYGHDLADYFSHEFRIPNRGEHGTPPRVPVWEDYFGLFDDHRTEDQGGTC
jgi:hypothetical protein